VDIDSDGVLDHIKPVCHDRYCDDPAIVMLKHDSPHWIEIARGFKTEGTHGSSYGFVLQTALVPNQMKFPLTLRFSDFNGDGFPDFVILVKEKGTSIPKVGLLINTPSNDTNFTRTFTLLMPPVQPQKESRTPVVVAFFDLYEDGKPDIIVSSVETGSSDYKNVYVDILINFKMYDATFIKVMVASGLCYDDCSAVKGPNSTPTFEPTEDNVLLRGVAYGTNQPGPHICHQLIDQEGYTRKGCSGQLTQSANFPLQMPYAIFGLGSTPNFVDFVNATIPGPNTSKIRTREWTQIVPDAQVVLIPYPIDEPSQWRSKLFLTPSDMVISTLITLASICILLIIVIAFLHRKEILEDIAEHEEYKRHWPDSR
jgi:integrin alpha FG-GAP repeat containing protein 1